MSIKLFDKLFFMGPMSLGDSIVANGIVNYYADRCHELHLPINHSFKESLHYLYSESSNIKCVEFPPNPSTYSLEDEYCNKYKLSRVLRPPVYSQPDNADIRLPYLWNHQLYSLLELPYELRYSNFRLPKETEKSKELASSFEEPFALVHRGTFDNPNGLNFYVSSDYKIIDLTAPLSANIFDYVGLIRKAEDIHCVSSAFLWLVDSIVSKQDNKNLYYHDVRKTAIMHVSNPWNDFKWNVVYYHGKDKQ